MHKPSRFIAGAALWLAASAAFGLGFGRTTLTSSLGQPLSFALTLRLQPGENVEAECLKAEVISGESHLPSGAVHATLRGQTGDVDERAVMITTTTLIDEPIVTINVSVGCPPTLTRSFVAFVDPPVLNLARAEAPAAAQSPAEQRARPEPPTPRPPRASRPRAAAAPSAASRPTQASTAASAPTEPAAPPPVHRARPRAPAPATPASAPSASTPRSIAPVAVRNQPAPAPAAGPRLQLESARLVARAPDIPAASSAASRPARTLAAAESSGDAGLAPPIAAASAASALASMSAAAALQPAAIASAATAAASAARVASSTQPAVAAAPLSSADAERLRLQNMEDTLARLRAESLANTQTLLAIQARLREAESSQFANPVVYLLAALCLLLALGMILLMRLRSRDRREQKWWATPEGEAVRAAASAFRASAVAPLSGPGALSERPLARGTAAAAQGSAVTEMTMPAVAAPTTLGQSGRTGAGALDAPRREMTVEELIDLEQQVDFFVALGQDESAIDMLLSHLRGSGAGNPLPYLKLLDIYLARGERDAYERIRERFNQQFNAVAPTFGTSPDEGRTIDQYPQLFGRLQFLWRDPSQALEVLNSSLFTRGEASARFDLPAYRDLLFLYALARDLAERETGSDVDLLLPLGDGARDNMEESAEMSPMLSTMAVAPNPLAQRPLEVDFDVSQPADLDALQPGAFEPSTRGSDYGADLGSGFGALSADRSAIAGKSSRR